MQDLSRNIARLVGGQEPYRFGDVRGQSKPAQRNLLLQQLFHVGRQALRHRGIDEAGRDRVHRDLPARVLACDRLRQADHRRLRGRIVRLAGIPHHADDRGDINDAAEALLRHRLQDRLGAVERAVEIHLKDQVPVLLAHPQQEAVARDAGIVDEDVDPAPLLEDLVDHRLDVARVGDVHLEIERAAAELLDRGDGLFGAPGIQIGDDDVGASLREGFGNGAADALRRAGDDGMLAVKVHACNACKVASKVLGSETFKVFASGAMRLMRPARTAPGPTSTKVLTPSPGMTLIDSAQRTGDGSCRINASWPSEARRSSFASALLTSGTDRSDHFACATSFDNRSAAVCISGVCTGTLTGSGIAFRQPWLLAISMARSTAARSPAITICPGQLKFAGATTPTDDASRQAARTASGSIPRIAATRPLPGATASAMYRPRF